MTNTKIIYNEVSSFDPDLLKRTNWVQKTYEEVLDGLKNDLKEPSEFVLEQFFEHPKQRVSIASNQYPYDLSLLKPCTMEHGLLWSKEPLEHQDIISFLSLWCGQKNIYSIWENCEERKSVKKLYHYHFILKN